MAEIIKLNNSQRINKGYQSDIDKNIKIHILELRLEKIRKAGILKRISWVFFGCVEAG